MSRMCFNCMKMTEDGEFCVFCGKKLKTAPAHHLLPGTVLNGKYTIGYALGEGGFGVTYIGLDNSLQIKVAIKEFFPKGIVGRNSTITPDVSCLNTGESDKLFATEKAKVINEARILAKFSKELGIVNVREYFEANNTAYIVMEYLEGETLEEYLAHSGPISVDEAYTLLHPVMKVLGQLHNEGVVHRDISPDNLMFDGEQIKLLDFGAAREVLYSTSKSFSVILKHGYAPEEQYRRKGHQGAWTDIYSLCATMYYCITNVIPDTSLDRMHEDELKRPSDLGVPISEQQEDALMRGLSVLPEDRLHSVADFIAVWNGDFVAMPNPQKETVAAYKDIQGSAENYKKINTSGAETVYGGQAAFASVDAEERRVSGYYSATDFSSTPVVEEPAQKNKKKGVLVAILCFVAAIILIGAIILTIILLSGKESANDNKGSDNNIYTSQNTTTTDNNKGTTPDASDSTTTTEAQEPTRDPLQTYLDQSESYLNAGNYTEAVAVLDTAEQLLGEHPEIKTQRQNVAKAQLLNTVSTYEKSDDYASAIKAIQSSDVELQNDAEVLQKLNSLKITYRNKVVADADVALGKSGYSEATRIANNGLSILPDDTTLLSKIEEYQAYAPVSLEDVTLTNGDDYSFKDSAKDPRGTVYNDVLLLESDWVGGWDHPILAGEVEFYTDRKYSTFECTLLPNDNFSKSEKAKGGQLQIYADGKLVYTSVTLSYKTNGIKVSVNIGNAEYITFKVVNNSYESYYCASMFLLDAVVKK